MIREQTLSETTGHADCGLWICDMKDPPNRKGVDAMEAALSEHAIGLYILSVKVKPGPSVRKLAEGSDGDWKVVALKKTK